MAEAAAMTAEVLGIAERDRPLSLLALADEVGKGLPATALDRLALAVAPDDRSFPYRLMPRATLARRRAEGGSAARLTPEASARVARLAEVWAMALDVWKSDDAARRFLFRPHMLLMMRKPIDVVLESEFGAPLVENILGGLKYGTAV